MLPDSKAAFPKCLYLDQNFWIGFCQAANGLPDGKKFESALSAVRQGVNAGKLVVPMSLVNIIEACISGREDRRKNLMDFMLALSQNKSIAHYKQVRPLEIENAIRQWYSLGGLRPIRQTIIRETAFGATGANPDLSMVPAECLPLVESVVQAAAVFQSAFVAVSDNREAVKNAVAQEIIGAEQLQQIREHAQRNLNERQREVLNCALMFQEAPITGELTHALQMTGIPMQRWVHEIMEKPDEIVRFSEDIPFIDVFVRLGLLHDRNTSKVYEKNDVRDLVWMAVALPYSNIIAGETYWTTLATTLGKKYATVLTNDPQTLPGLLLAEGCC